MKLLSNLVAASIVVSGTALAGIDIGLPLISGEVATLEARHETSRKELSQTQLQALSHWLGLHKSGWHGMVTEATSEPAVLRISLKDANGRTGSIAVLQNAHGGHYLRFVSSSEKWSYRSFGGLFKSWATHALSAEELNQLLHAVSIPEMPN
jgi:hypothetical protein